MLFVVASALAAYGIATFLCWAVIQLWYWWPEELPQDITWSVAIAFWGILLGLGTIISLPVRRDSDGKVLSLRIFKRLLSVVALLLIVSLAGVQINQYFGSYPTVRDVVKGSPTLERGLPKVAISASSARHQKAAVGAGWSPPAGLPSKGELRSVSIPGTVSGLRTHDAVVYLPPAYFAKQRPLLPVLVLVEGQPGTPADWVQAGHIGEALDAFAAQHKGLAPVVVMPDPNGYLGNTMCMDSQIAKADSYMAKDVPHWIIQNLDVDVNPEHWAVGGFSYGGTCAMQMVTRHPERYPNFVAISSELEPALASNRNITIAKSFNGDVKKFEAQVPMHSLAHKKYPEVGGLFITGADDVVYTNNAKQLAQAAANASMQVKRISVPGGHSWVMVAQALPQAFDYLAPRLGIE